MKKTIISALLVCLCGVLAQGQQAPTAPGVKDQLQFSAGYMYQGSKTTFDSSRFGLNGGRADMLVPLSQHLGLVAEFSGVHTGSVPGTGTGLTLLTYMAGPRMTMPMHRGRETARIAPFTQVLFGGAHGSEGLFPSGSVMHNSGNSFAMTAGGGLQVGVCRRISLRVVQAEYLYTHLPNLFDNYQNSYRIGTGVVLQLR